MEWIFDVLGSPVFSLLAKTMLHSLWQGALVALVLFVLLQNISVKHSQLRYVLSLIALCLCAISPVLTFYILEQTSNVSSYLTVAATYSGNGDMMVSHTDGRTVQDLEWLSVTGLVWMAGVVAFSIQLIVRMYQVYRLPYSHTAVPSKVLLNRFDALKAQIDTNPLTRLLVSHRVDVPMVIGWLKPVVLLPASMAIGLTPKQLDMLLAHELAHVKRYDYLVNFLQSWVEVILFFHPTVRWISKQVRIEREYCCDDMAVEACGCPLAYATALTDAELARPNNIPQLAMAASGGDLKQRVFRLVGHQYCAPRGASHWIVGSIAAFFALATVVTLFSARHVVGMQHSSRLPLNDQVTLQSDNIATTPVPTVAVVSQRVDAPSENAIDNGSGESVEAEIPSQVTPQNVKAIDTQSKPENTEHKSRIPNEKVAPSSDPKPATEQQSAETTEAVTLAEQALAIPKISRQPPDLIEKLAAIEQTVFTTEEPQPQPIVNDTPRIVNPVILDSVTPSYPRVAIKRQLEGEIKVTFVVNTDGEAEQISFEDGVHRSFRRSITRALEEWEFSPGSVDGELQNMQMSKIFSFTNPEAASVPITGSRIAKL
ncbi:M56 family metallopeptidase [Aestuariibacter salexigens]|uniref:M56 family metallopeptidase n=1 Tax=Aestuariibacter salexigens TaxID=226010 RepID=UPI000425684F|nr:M56 family metallopeptidase [Aestuariibacter salexigens]